MSTPSSPKRHIRKHRKRRCSEPANILFSVFKSRQTATLIKSTTQMRTGALLLIASLWLCAGVTVASSKTLSARFIATKDRYYYTDSSPSEFVYIFQSVAGSNRIIYTQTRPSDSSTYTASPTVTSINGTSTNGTSINGTSLDGNSWDSYYYTDMTVQFDISDDPREAAQMWKNLNDAVSDQRSSYRSAFYGKRRTSQVPPIYVLAIWNATDAQPSIPIVTKTINVHFWYSLPYRRDDWTREFSSVSYCTEFSRLSMPNEQERFFYNGTNIYSVVARMEITAPGGLPDSFIIDIKMFSKHLSASYKGLKAYVLSFWNDGEVMPQAPLQVSQQSAKVQISWNYFSDRINLASNFTRVIRDVYESQGVSLSNETITHQLDRMDNVTSNGQILYRYTATYNVDVLGYVTDYGDDANLTAQVNGFLYLSGPNYLPAWNQTCDSYRLPRLSLLDAWTKSFQVKRLSVLTTDFVQTYRIEISWQDDLPFTLELNLTQPLLRAIHMPSIVIKNLNLSYYDQSTRQIPAYSGVYHHWQVYEFDMQSSRADMNQALLNLQQAVATKNTSAFNGANFPFIFHVGAVWKNDERQPLYPNATLDPETIDYKIRYLSYSNSTKFFNEDEYIKLFSAVGAVKLVKIAPAEYNCHNSYFTACMAVVTVRAQGNITWDNLRTLEPAMEEMSQRLNNSQGYYIWYYNVSDFQFIQLWKTNQSEPSFYLSTTFNMRTIYTSKFMLPAGMFVPFLSEKASTNVTHLYDTATYRTQYRYNRNLTNYDTSAQYRINEESSQFFLALDRLNAWAQKNGTLEYKCNSTSHGNCTVPQNVRLIRFWMEGVDINVSTVQNASKFLVVQYNMTSTNLPYSWSIWQYGSAIRMACGSNLQRFSYDQQYTVWNQTVFNATNQNSTFNGTTSFTMYHYNVTAYVTVQGPSYDIGSQAEDALYGLTNSSLNEAIRLYYFYFAYGLIDLQFVTEGTVERAHVRFRTEPSGSLNSTYLPIFSSICGGYVSLVDQQNTTVANGFIEYVLSFDISGTNATVWSAEEKLSDALGMQYDNKGSLFNQTAMSLNLSSISVVRFWYGNASEPPANASLAFRFTGISSNNQLAAVIAKAIRANVNAVSLDNFMPESRKRQDGSATAVFTQGRIDPATAKSSFSSAIDEAQSGGRNRFAEAAAVLGYPAVTVSRANDVTTQSSTSGATSTVVPTSSPTVAPTLAPTVTPTSVTPTSPPTVTATAAPTTDTTSAPTAAPTVTPTSVTPTSPPTVTATAAPTTDTTSAPTAAPTVTPTSVTPTSVTATSASVVSPTVTSTSTLTVTHTQETSQETTQDHQTSQETIPETTQETTQEPTKDKETTTETQTDSVATSGPPEPTNSTAQPTDKSLKPGQKAGIAIGVILGVGLIAAAAVFFYLRRRKQKSEEHDLLIRHNNY
ncbi:Cohesin domain protein [Planoprotostelium fungivorum]|uniref:Cohesin domain protein n=1 Tax=Planoprotostelium fungivorum TaxID=1890364 RepID=A0A2P6NF55_9EUKA|nr:Cohesin domain protein [Planoprotostelium fungivorum]